MACLRLFTVPPLPPRPDFRVPFFLRRMALSHSLARGLSILAAGFFPEPFFFAAISFPPAL
jgi:hypothetical protein